MSINPAQLEVVLGSSQMSKVTDQKANTQRGKKKKRAVLGQTRHDLQSPFSIPAKTPKKNGGENENRRVCVNIDW